MRIIWQFLRVWVLLGALIWAAAVAAQTRPSDIVQAQFMPGWRLDSDRHVAAVAITLAPGWKTYWRVPGEAGIAPKLHLSGPGLTQIDVLWPEPHLFSQAGVLGIGYRDAVIVPIILHGAPQEVRGQLDIGVCDDICVPVSFAITGRVGAARQPSPPILAALAEQPLTGREAGIAAPLCRIEPNGQGVHLHVTLALAGRAVPEHMVLEPHNAGLHVAPRPTLKAEGDQIVASFAIRSLRDGPVVLARDQLRFTLLGNGRAVELQGCSPP